MNEAENVYLLPLFLKNMSFRLKFPPDKLCDKMTEQITIELENTHTEILEKLVHVYPKKMENKKIIRELEDQFVKVHTQSGGKQIKVLFLLRELSINLDHWQNLSKTDLTRLKKIVDSDDLFSNNYNTGIDAKTIKRFLAVNNKNLQADDKKIKLLFEVFKKRLEGQNIRDTFFNRYFSDATCVRSAFFTYRGNEIIFENEDSLINDILELKRIPFETFFSKLENICSDLGFIHQGQPIPRVEPVVEPITENEENAAYEAQLKEDSYYAEFHSRATNFLKYEMALKIKLDDRDAMQDLYSIVEDAWCVFTKMCRKDIAMGMGLKVLPIQELVIHSLHNKEKYHLQLCSSFKYWKQGDTL